jgi:ribosomal protein L44E
LREHIERTLSNCFLHPGYDCFINIGNRCPTCDDKSEHKLSRKNHRPKNRQLQNNSQRKKQRIKKILRNQQTPQPHKITHVNPINRITHRTLLQQTRLLQLLQMINSQCRAAQLQSSLHLANSRFMSTLENVMIDLQRQTAKNILSIFRTHRISLKNRRFQYIWMSITSPNS